MARDANLALLEGTGEAGSAQGPPSAQQAQPDCPTGKAQQAEDQNAPVQIALIVLHSTCCTWCISV